MPNSIPLSGAVPALRGYRTQFLYTLHRILKANNEEVIYPELYEDYSVKENDILTEVAQIKNLTDPLVLSKLDPSKKDSFFRRSINLLKQEGSPKIKIISLGLLGREFTDFQNGDSVSDIADKLIKNHNYDSDEVAVLLKQLEVVTIQEDDLQAQINLLLSETLAGIDISIGCDLLLFWLYQMAEQQQEITRSSLIQKIEEVGQFISERHQFLNEYGKSIRPLSPQHDLDQSENLQPEFLSGISATYQHILANLDILRPEKMEALDQAFQKSKIVILHGASGQGKSTLAYRYINERYPQGYGFQISVITGLEHVLNLSQAIEALAKPFFYPFIIFIDVMPGDVYWVDLCRRLSEIKNCRVLIGIREEDLRRSASIEEFLSTSQLQLNFSEEEAERLFTQYRSQIEIPHFFNFADAWVQFGGKGPLLEFVYMLRKGERLRDKIYNQLERIQDRIIQAQEPNQLKLLKSVAIAGAYDCKIDLKKVLQSLQLNNPKRTISLFEEEYLLRSSENGKYLEALHPVRARLMTELLFDPLMDSVQEGLASCLPFIAEEDWGNFVLQYAYHFGWPEAMMNILLELQPTKWQTCREVLSSMVWCGVQNYVKSNEALISKLKTNFPDGYSLALMLHIAQTDNFPLLETLFGKEGFGEIASILSTLAPLETFYDVTNRWLSSVVLPRDIDTSSAYEISALGYISFWIGHLKIEKKPVEHTLIQVKTMDTEHIHLDSMADLLLGLHYGDDNCLEAVSQLMPKFVQEFQAFGKIPWLEDDGQKIKVHFFFDFDQFGTNDQDRITHDGKAMSLLRIIRKAIPFREKYSSQGYGHQLREIPLPYDDTRKEITSKHLALPWITDANKIFLNLIAWEDRPTNWQALLESLLANRENICDSIIGILSGLKRICKSNKLVGAHNILADTYLPDSIIKLPKETIDKWGFTGDFIDKNDLNNLFHQTPLLQILEPELKPAFKAISDFHFSIRNFLSQASKSLMLKEVSQGWTQKDWIEKEEQLRSLGYSSDVLRLSKYNLTQAYEQLEAYQQAMRLLLTSNAHLSPETKEDLLANVLAELQIIWPYFLEMKPGKVSDLNQVVLRKEAAILNEFEQKLNYRLNKLKTNGLVEDTELLISSQQKGDWCIILYIKSYEQVLLCWDMMKNLLFESLAPAPLNSFKRIVLEKHIRRFWLIPLCDDFLISRSALKLDIFHVFDHLENPEFRITMFGRVTNEMIEELDVEEASITYPAFGYPERFNILIKSIEMSLQMLAPLKSLWGKSEVGNMLVDLQVRKLLLESYKRYKEAEEFIGILITDVEFELAQSMPFIPETRIMEFVGPIFEQINRLSDMIEMLKDDLFNPSLFDVIEDISSSLNSANDKLNAVYWNWLEMMIHRHLHSGKEAN